MGVVRVRIPVLLENVVKSVHFIMHWFTSSFSSSAIGEIRKKKLDILVTLFHLSLDTPVFY